MLHRSIPVLVSLCLAASALAARAQSTPPSAGTQAPYRLQAASRIVLTDVTVTDRNGNPVHDLPASAFRIFDDNQPQQLASFEEHEDASAAVTPIPASSNGAYSNAFLQHLPPILNVVLIDTTNLELPDQMYLSFQLTKFIDALPAGQPIAIFERHGDTAVLQQTFTANHDLLLAAVRRSLPRIVLTGREYRTDTDTLHQIAVALSQVPGRKNLLWFSGGSTLFLLTGLEAVGTTAPAISGPTVGTTSVPTTPAAASAYNGGPDADALRQVYDELEAARIAVFPIDARGLTAASDYAYNAQQSAMNDEAQATGGQAFFNMNSLAQIAGHILSTGNSAYTLTYSPKNFHYDGKWHTVRVTVKGPYRLSYRRGYFADSPHAAPPGKPSKQMSLLASDSGPAVLPDLRSAPILFQADVRPTSAAPPSAGFIVLRPPQPPAKGTTAFAVDYSLSTAAFTPAIVDGAPRATIVFAVIALNSNGERVGQTFDRVRLALKPDRPPMLLKVQQQIDLHKGGDFLTLIVWDATSGRLGTLRMPLQVNAPSRSK